MASMRERHGPSANLTIHASLMAKRIETKKPCNSRSTNHHQNTGSNG